MPSCTVDKIAQVSDAGISGPKPYTGNYPSVILDTLRRPHGRRGLTVEALGHFLGMAMEHESVKQESLSHVQEALDYLEDLGLVFWTGELWTLKKVRL